MRYRIYHKDRFTNEIWYLETIWTGISYDYLEQYLKINNKKFLYITNVKYVSKKKQEQEWYMSKHQDQCSEKIRES